MTRPEAAKWSTCDCPFPRGECSFPMMSYKCKINLYWDELPVKIQEELIAQFPGWVEQWIAGVKFRKELHGR